MATYFDKHPDEVTLTGTADWEAYAARDRQIARRRFYRRLAHFLGLSLLLGGLWAFTRLRAPLSLEGILDHGVPSCHHRHHCSEPPHTEQWDFDAPPHLALNVSFHPPPHNWHEHAASLTFVPAPVGQGPAVRVEAKSYGFHAEATAADTGLSISTPYFDHGGCVALHVTAYVKPDTPLEFLDISVEGVHVDFRAVEGLRPGKANFTLTTASLTGGAGLAPRRTVVRVGSGSVNGDWALRDFLGFYVETGSVSIDVKPEEEEKEGVRPTFEVEVGTGSVQLRYPPVGWVVPRREYVTKIGARTGSVGGNIVHGVETDVLVGRGRGDKGRVGSGSINLAVKPVEGRWNSTLSTEGRGSTNVRVLTPVHAEGAWKGLRSSHREGVGSVNLHYPAVWEGRIKGTTQGWGSLSVRGSGVEVIKESRGEIEAVKGHGEGSELEFWVGMGSGHLFVGDD